MGRTSCRLTLAEGKGMKQNGKSRGMKTKERVDNPTGQRNDGDFSLGTITDRRRELGEIPALLRFLNLPKDG